MGTIVEGSGVRDEDPAVGLEAEAVFRHHNEQNMKILHNSPNYRPLCFTVEAKRHFVGSLASKRLSGAATVRLVDLVYCQYIITVTFAKKY